MKNSERFRPRTNEPVHIRRNVELDTDPYIDDEQLADNSVCKLCGDVYMSGRWYHPDQPSQKTQTTVQSERNMVICPACRKSQDRVPGGVLKLTGDFLRRHRDEILNLIRNETTKAQVANPLERVMSMESDHDELEITTTNEKLAQRIGKALHKAYSGNIEYKWSEDTKLARVNWHREL